MEPDSDHAAGLGHLTMSHHRYRGDVEVRSRGAHFEKSIKATKAIQLDEQKQQRFVLAI